jgi:hypothetical protein
MARGWERSERVAGLNMRIFLGLKSASIMREALVDPETALND